MLEFPFCYSITVDGWTAATLEGVLVLEGDPASDRREDHADWSVDEIQLDVGRVIGPAGSRALERRREVLDNTHWLHDRLLADVISRYLRDIDEAWGRFMRERLATARGRFVTHRPDPSV